MRATKVARARRRTLLFAALAAAFPFLFYFRHVFPSSSLLVIGNDFGVLYYSYKAYLTERVAAGALPLWSPAEACGYSFFANPFTAILYPLNVIPLALRGLAGHYNRGFHQAFTVLGVSIFSLGLYLWLVASFRQRRAALFTACVLSASWAVSSFMRLPNAIHVLAWTPWVLLALLETHRGAGRRVRLLGATAFFCQITAGYPYFVVYACLMYALYLGFLVLGRGRDRLRACLVMLAVPVFLTTPYTAAVAGLMSVTTDRSGGDFAYSTHSSLTPIQLVGAALFPPVAGIEGCFYSGFLAAFLGLFYCWAGRPSSTKQFVFLTPMAVLVWALGHHSYLYTLAWNLMPVLHQMRGLARSTVFLLLILGLALHQGYVRLSRHIVRPGGGGVGAAPVLLVVLAVVQIGLYLGRAGFDADYKMYVIPSLPHGAHAADFLVYTLLTALAVMLLPRLGLNRVRWGADLVLAILVLLTTTDAGSQGRFLWSQPLAAALPAVPTAPGMDSGGTVSAPLTTTLKRAQEASRQQSTSRHLIDAYFELDRPPGRQGLRSSQLTFEPLENYYYGSYNRFLAEARREPESLAALMGARKLYLHERLVHPDVTTFLADAAASNAPPPRLIAFDGNDLEVEVETDRPLYLSWIDNTEAGWSVRVDGGPAVLEPLFGTFKSVHLPNPGRRHVAFRYRPAMPGWSVALCGLGVVGLALLATRRDL